MFRFARLALCLGLVGAPAGSAHAGAWTLERGTGFAILDVARLGADRRLEADRRSAPAPDFGKAEGRVLVEYGLTDAVTLRMRGAFETWRQDGASPSSWRGIAVGEAGARAKVFEGGRFVGSLEGSLRLVEPQADAAAEFEMRALGGASFELLDRPAFIDAQLGYRFRPDAETDEMLVDLTVGIRPADRTLLLLQSFSTVATTPTEDGRPAYDHHKLQGSAVFDVTRRWSLQVGGGRTIAGSNALRERSAFASVWLRF